MKMKAMVGLVLAAALCLCNVGSILAQGSQEFDVIKAREVHVTGNNTNAFRIGGTRVTATAAQLNALVAGTQASASLAISNANNAGSATITMQADKGDDAGDKVGLVVADGAGLAVQSDVSVKGTLATKASIGTDGVLNTLIGLDGIGAIDLDIGSADITDIQFITDGTGTAEVVMPAGSVDSTEILDATVAPADVAEGVVVSPTGYSGTGVKMQFGSIPTNGTGTITFQDAFSAVPAVTVCAEALTTNIWYVTTVTASNFVYVGEANVAGGYIAIGLK